MNKRWKNLTACALAAVMGISSIASPVYAQEAGGEKTETVTDVETAVNSLSDEEETTPLEETYAAQDSNGNQYTTLQDAIAEAEEGLTVSLLTDTDTSSLNVTKNITLDLNGHSITSSLSLTVASDKSFAIKGEGEIGGLTNDRGFSDGGVLYINGGTFTENVYNWGNMVINDGDFDSLYTTSNNANTTVNGGTFVTLSSSGTMTITGGTVSKVTCANGTTTISIKVGRTVTVTGGTVNLNTADIGRLQYVSGTVNFGDNVLSLDKSSLSLDTVDETTETLSVTIGSATISGNLPVFWESGDDSTTTVSGSNQNADVTAVSPGTTTITATSGGKTVSCEVTVKLVSTLSITTTSDEMSKTYDGKPVTEPTVNKTGTSSEVTFTWWQKNADGSWDQIEEAPADAGSYKVVARAGADDAYSSASDELEFTIRQATNEWTTELSIENWTYGEEANAPTAAAKYGEVVFTYSDSENGTFEETVPTTAGPWYVKAAVAESGNYGGLTAVKAFRIEKADSQISFKEDFRLDKPYDTQAVQIDESAVTKTGSANDVTFAWQQKNGDEWTDLPSAPVNAGNYRVAASVAEDTNYNGTIAYLEFTISQTANEWTEELSISDWIYGETASTPTASAKYGEVVFTYSDSRDGEYASDVPTTAGIWYVKATVTGNASYTGLEEVQQFEIFKADSTIEFAERFTPDKDYDGTAVGISETDVIKTGSTSDVTFTWQQKNGDEWTELPSAPADAGSYKVTASVAEDANYKGASAYLEFIISQTANEWTEELSIENWTYGEQANAPTAAAKYGEVVFTYSDSENGTFEETVPTTAGPWYVKAAVAESGNYGGLTAVKAFRIEKADSQISFKEDFRLDKPYDTQAVQIDESAVTKTGSTSDVIFTWEQKNGDEWTDLPSAPVNAGSYRVVASVAEDTNYNGTTAYLEFAISQTVNEWTADLSLSDWTYGETAGTPTAAAKYGEVIFTYSDSENGIFEATVPATAGTWYVKAAVAGNDSYTGLEAVQAFEIRKAVPAYTVPTGLTIRQGQTLSSVVLPNGFTWVDAAQTVDAWGVQTFKALFTPTDVENYQTVEVDITVNVSPAQAAAGQAPAASGNTGKGTADSAQAAVMTGDSGNIIGWTVLVAVSALSVGLSVLFRRRKRNL